MTQSRDESHVTAAAAPRRDSGDAGFTELEVTVVVARRRAARAGGPPGTPADWDSEELSGSRRPPPRRGSRPGRTLLRPTRMAPSLPRPLRQGSGWTGQAYTRAGTVRPSAAPAAAARPRLQVQVQLDSEAAAAARRLSESSLPVLH